MMLLTIGDQMIFEDPTSQWEVSHVKHPTEQTLCLNLVSAVGLYRWKAMATGVAIITLTPVPGAFPPSHRRGPVTCNVVVM